MDITKIFTILCGFLLIICLTLSITCLVVMRNAVDETSFWQDRAEELVGELGGCVQAMKDMESEDVPVIAPEETDKEKESTRYCLRLDGDSIGIYDTDGYLIKNLHTSVSILPQKEREKLTAGIWTESCGEMQKLVQDYE
jgi:hypothetical protein